MSIRTVSKTIDLMSIPSDITISKYITVIGNDGIKVHPYNTTAGQADTDNYVKIDSDSIEIWQKPEGASASIKVAEFDVGGIQIGSMAGYHVDINSSGMSLINSGSNVFWAGTNGVAYLPSPAAGGFRISKDGFAVNMILSNASRRGSSYETATASNNSIAYGGEISYIDDGVLVYKQTEASGEYSCAGGKWAVAKGNVSTAHGIGVLAEYEAQTVCGKYNSNQSANAFEIGNGIADGVRSNALTVDWSGKVSCGDQAGNFKSIFDIFYPIGSYYETSLPSEIPSEESTPTETDLVNLGSTWFDPNYAWGGTWELEIEGQVHISGSNNGTYQVEGALTNTSDGGEEEHQLTSTESYYPSRISTTLSISSTQVSQSGTTRYAPTVDTANKWTKYNAHTASAHNNMQPYIVVNRWHRIA